jgi:hypothetical protein
MELTESEKEYLISQLKHELVWTTCMLSRYSSYQERKDILESILSKLGQHPFKILLENNIK